MQDRMFALPTPEAVDAFLQQYPIAAIFKAGTCHKTMQGWSQVEQLLNVRPSVPVGVIRVVEQRPASNHVAERTQIVHQSPQLILFRDGQALFDLDNWNITTELMTPLFAQHLSDVPIEEASQSSSNLEPYTKLMDAFLEGQISEFQFTSYYVNTLREDSSLRNQEEFALLDSLFGDPDTHHIHLNAVLHNEQAEEQPLYERVKALRAQFPN